MYFNQVRVLSREHETNSLIIGFQDSFPQPTDAATDAMEICSMAITDAIVNATDDDIDATAGVTVIDAMRISFYGAVTNSLEICSMANTTTSITKNGKLILF